MSRTATNPFHGSQHEEQHDQPRLVDPAIRRSRAGIRAVAISLAVLTVTAVTQTVIYALTLSVALLADLIHNFVMPQALSRSNERSRFPCMSGTRRIPK
jgi:Co/Zn/Cd efflux system component